MIYTCFFLLHTAIILRYAAMVAAVRINFTGCQNPEWICTNATSSYEAIYTCSAVRSNDFIIHLKDFYTGHITGLTIQNCRDVRVVLDCPPLQRHSLLQRLFIKDCDRLEFVSLTINSIVQTPPEVMITDVKEIVSLPRKIFKSPSTTNELKCSGVGALKKIKIVNSKINTINTRAVFNVSGIKSIEFHNVTISDIQNQAIEAIMDNNDENTIFSLTNSRIENLKYKAIVIQSNTAIISENIFDEILTNAVNITADNINIIGNQFKEVNGLVLKFVDANISRNFINVLKGNALTNVECSRRRTNRMQQFIFSNNNIENLEPHSLIFDYNSCKSGTIEFHGNRINCKCRDIAFINSDTTDADLRSLILDVVNNNTCLSAPCVLPVDVLKLLLDNGMCHVKLDPEVMCLIYNDKHAAPNEVTTDEDITEPEPTFYLIRQANPANGDVSAAMTAINKDDLLRDSNLNRTAIKIVFDSSRDFVETLRSTSTSQKGQTQSPNSAPREEYVNRCIGAQCRNNVAYDRQKALDFYKYVYAQLRSPIRPIKER